MKKGPLFVLSGPSGSGKSTLVSRLLADSSLPLHLAVSATTRAPRPGEKDGIHYHFWDQEKFEKAMAAGEFLEWANVFGHRYGTLATEVLPYRDKGMGVLLEIDVHGWQQVKRLCPDAVSIFLRTSTLDEYEKRLRSRGTEGEAAIRRRLDGARTELAQAGDYTYEVINDDLDQAVAEVTAIMRKLF
jgi:guanylate kinase